MPLISDSFRTAALGLICAATLLQGCGGDDSSSPSTSPSPADYLRIGVVSEDASAGKTLVIFDPDAPATPRLSLRLSATDSFETSMRVRYDLTSQTVTLLGESAVFVVQGKQLHKVSLKKTDATTARRVSSIDSACSVGTDYLTPDEAGWLAVTDAGADADCSTVADNRIAYVRPDASALTAPVRLPAGVSLVGVLPDASWLGIQHLLALDSSGTPKLTLYRPDLTAAGDVTGGQVGNVLVLARPFAPGQVTVAADNELRTLTWSSSGATLGAPGAYHYAEAPTYYNGQDANALYFADGRKVVRVPHGGTGQVIATLSAEQGETAELDGVYGDTLLLSQANLQTGLRTLIALPKTGGAPVTLHPAASAYFFGVSGNTAYINTYTFISAGFDYVSQASLKRVNFDGSQASTVAAQAHTYAKPIYSRTQPLTAGSTVDGFTWCERASGESTCANGTMKMLNAITGATVTLGVFAHADAYTTWSPFDFNNFNIQTLDTPLVFISRGAGPDIRVGENEVFIARPNVANSLVKVNVAP